MPRSSYIRKGIERSLLRREQALRALRQHFADNMRDNVDPASLELQRAGAVEAMRLHLILCTATLRDLERYAPSYFDTRSQTFHPLTPAILAARRAARSVRALAHADEAKKSKSRRAKNA